MSIVWAWLARYALLGGAIVGSALLVALGVQTLRLNHASGKFTELQNLVTVERAKTTAAALEATTQNRALEQQMQAQSQKAERAYHAAQSRNDSILAAARADVGKLRNDLATFARGGGPAVDTAPAASGRAEALGELLGRALQADAEHASAAESNADAVRSLLDAWPANASSDVKDAP